MHAHAVAGLVFGIAASIASFASVAAEKLDEGVSTGLTRRGNLNRVSSAFSDDAVYFWMRIKDKEGTKSKTRCVVTDPNGVPLLDETEDFDEDGEEGYLFCGVDGDEKELSAGTHTFAIYLNGEKMGERTVAIEKRSFFGKLSVFKQFKYALGLLAAAIIAYYWIRKKLYGDRTIDKAFPEKTAPGASKVVIGSKLAGAGAPSAQAPPPAPTIEDQVRNFKARIAADANFRLARAEDVLPIAKAARSAGDSKTAIAAVRGFDKAFPGHALIPDVFVFSAKLLAEDFKNNDMARKILEHVIARYPGHYLAQEARSYLKEMPQGA